MLPSRKVSWNICFRGIGPNTFWAIPIPWSQGSNVTEKLYYLFKTSSQYLNKTNSSVGDRGKITMNIMTLQYWCLTQLMV